MLKMKAVIKILDKLQDAVNAQWPQLSDQINPLWDRLMDILVTQELLENADEICRKDNA
jgi:hypothetical protein